MDCKLHMAELSLEHMHEDLETLKQDIALIKHIMIEEGLLTEDAKKRLKEARQTSDSKYTRLN